MKKAMVASQNRQKYETAWSLVDSAREELESVAVGTDKVLYEKIKRITEELGGLQLLISTELLER